MGGQPSITEIVARICEEARFTSREHTCFVLYYQDGLTLRQVSTRIQISLGSVHKHLARARAKLLVIEQTADQREFQWARLVLQLMRNRTTGRHKGAHQPSPACPEWVPVRVAARMCGVSICTMQNWIDDERNPLRAEVMEYQGRREVCVPRAALPLRPDFRPAPLHAKLVIPDDLVHWHNGRELRL